MSVTHTYTAPGPHTVTLTGSDALGNTSTLSRRVTVTAPTPAPPAPSNRFTASKPKVKGAKITFAVRLPGPGRLTVRAAYSVKRRQAGYASTSGTVKRGTRVVALKPSAAARKALKKLRRVKVTVTARYIPTGGTARSATVGRVTIKGGKR